MKWYTAIKQIYDLQQTTIEHEYSIEEGTFF